MSLTLNDVPFMRKILIQRVCTILKTKVRKPELYNTLDYIDIDFYHKRDVDSRAKLIAYTVINEKVRRVFELLYSGNDKPNWKDMIKEILTNEKEQLAVELYYDR